MLPLVASTTTPPGFERAALLRRLDDGEADAVLHRAARVQVLGLAVDGRADAAGHAVEAHEGRPADGFQDVVETGSRFMRPPSRGEGYESVAPLAVQARRRLDDAQAFQPPGPERAAA